MAIDGFFNQLPDIDPEETQEWLDSLESIVNFQGKTRARFLLASMLQRARELQVGYPATTSTPYVNSIPAEDQAWFPGDEFLEKRIRRFIRWNAAVMVVKANAIEDGIGGHLSTFASSASLYEVGFNHFFRGKADGLAGDHVYFQGHAAPGVYARAFLERRLDEEHLDNFRGRSAATAFPRIRIRGSCPTSGSTRPCPWGWDRSPRFTRRASTAISTTGNSTTPAVRGSGASSATAKPTSPRHSGRFRWLRERASTTWSGWSIATCSALTARCGGTARSSRSSKRCFGVPDGT